MFARMTTMEAQPAKLEEIVCYFQKCIVPAEERQTGFEGLLLLTDEDAGKAISIAFWRTKAEMSAFDSDCLVQMADEFATFLKAPPVVELHRVRVQSESSLVQPALQFGETSLGIRIEDPCAEDLSEPSSV